MRPRSPPKQETVLGGGHAIFTFTYKFVRIAILSFPLFMIAVQLNPSKTRSRHERFFSKTCRFYWIVLATRELLLYMWAKMNSDEQSSTYHSTNIGRVCIVDREFIGADIIAT